mgnify:CR=1 FL=1
MQLGFVSAILPDLELEEVLAFANAEGFECVELMAWPRGKAERRYAGVTHVDVATLDEGGADRVRRLLGEHGVEISGLGYYPNPLAPDPAEAQVYVGHLKANSLESGPYEIALWSRIARTVAIVLVCILAVPFAFGPLRSSGAGARTVAGILTGVLFFLVNRTLESSGQVYGLSPLVAAWAPTALLAAVTAFAVWRVR